MATKDYDLSLNGKSKPFDNLFSSQDNNQQQYSNINLNACHQFSAKIDSIQSESSSFKNNERKINDYNISKDKNDSSLWNKNENSQHKSLNLFNDVNQKESEKRWKNKDDSNKNSRDDSNKNSSTLSLHIAAYENLTEAINGDIHVDDDKIEAEKPTHKQKFKNVKQHFATSSSSAIQNLFEFPRQQENAVSKPEVMQFKTSQRLLNPNEPSTSNQSNQKPETTMAESHQSQPTSSGDYIVPKREVFAIFDMAKWYRSEAYDNYMNFIHRINDAVKGLQSNDGSINVSDRVKNVVAVFDEFEKWVQELPLEDMQEQRFGNKTYRKWYERLQERADDIINKLLPEDKKAAKIEVLPYLLDSFGNSTRIDYGSGHEVAFLFFVYCLYCTGALIPKEDDKAVVLRLFARYLRFVRLLQSKYRMEPAGSRGVHAIDDYQFAPFIFGSSQLIGNKQRLTPDHYLNAQTVEVYQRDNLFFEAIQYINETKYGPFYEHSNQLYNISAVPNWEKVNSGMFKMYEGECLKKFPVAQHFVFGSILSIKQRECFLQREEETRRALEKEKEEAAQKKAEDATTKEKHLIDAPQPMATIQEASAAE